MTLIASFRGSIASSQDILVVIAGVATGLLRMCPFVDRHSWSAGMIYTQNKRYRQTLLECRDDLHTKQKIQTDTLGVQG
jgi:hypothetical protein